MGEQQQQNYVFDEEIKIRANVGSWNGNATHGEKQDILFASEN